MELHIVLERGVEYNDEYYFFSGDDGKIGDPVKAFKNKVNAEAEAAALTKKRWKEDEYLEFEDGEKPDLYYVKTIKVADEDVVGYQANKSKLEEAKQKMKDAAEEYFKGEAKGVFESHPKLEAISVVAYVPYFNDGSPCEYSVHDPYIKFQGFSPEGGGDYGDGFDQPYTYEGCKAVYPKGMMEAYKAAQALISSVTEEDFETLFGDSVKVTITRDGVDTEEYDHE